MSPDGTTVTYATPKILSSAPGSAPFAFTVTATGEIPVKVSVTQSAIGAPFTGILATPIADVDLAQNGTHTYNAGVQWGELGNANAGTEGTVTWTVTCNEQPTVRHWSAGIAGPIDAVFPSTNAANQAAGWAYVTVEDSTITFQGARFTDLVGGSCIEYRFNDNTPDQRRFSAGVPMNNWNYPAVTDGLWPTKCIATDLNPTQTVTIPAGTTKLEVRSAFGAESDERFAWTTFNLLP